MSVTTTVRPKNAKQPIRLLLFALPVVLASAGIGVLSAKARLPEGQIANGVQVSEAKLGGKSREEAKAALQVLAQKFAAQIVTLQFPAEAGIKRQWKPSAAKLGLGIDTAATLAEAERTGRAGGLVQLVALFQQDKTTEVVPRPKIDEKKLRVYLKNQIAKDSNRAPKNARFLPAKGGLNFNKEKNGLAVDIEASAASIVKGWNAYLATGGLKPETPLQSERTAEPAKDEASGVPKPATPAQEPPVGEKPLQTPEKPSTSETAGPVFLLSAKITEPRIKLAELQQIDGILGSFSTWYAGYGGNRGDNIALAASHINGTVLRPGETFSYNKVVGPRSSETGFKEAHVIVRGKLEDGIGGGICQVSSTLYNAVLFSNLKITSRSHHAFPVAYLPAGRDATVVDGAIDFQFQNTTEAPVYISAAARGGRLSFALYGKQSGEKVSLQLVHHATIPAGSYTVRDPDLPAGRTVVRDRGHNGHRVSLYRTVRQNGQVVKKELISKDYYQPYAAEVAVGTRPVVTKAAKAVVPKTTPGTAPTAVTPAAIPTTPPTGTKTP